MWIRQNFKLPQLRGNTKLRRPKLQPSIQAALAKGMQLTAAGRDPSNVKNWKSPWVEFFQCDKRLDSPIEGVVTIDLDVLK